MITKQQIINNLDNLTRNAQTSLRCTIENHSSTCRFIMWCHSLSKVIPPLRSRCVCIHIPEQDDDDLKEWLLHIAFLERIPVSADIINEIIDNSNGNLKTILWKLTLYNYKNSKNQENHFFISFKRKKL